MPPVQPESALQVSCELARLRAAKPARARSSLAGITGKSVVEVARGVRSVVSVASAQTARPRKASTRSMAISEGSAVRGAKGEWRERGRGLWKM